MTQDNALEPVVDRQQLGEASNFMEGLPDELKELIKQKAQQLQESSSASAQKITVQSPGGGFYVMPYGDKVKTFTGIIVASKHINRHYTSQFNPNSIEPPDCAAVSFTGDAKNEDLIPLDDSSHKYSESCKTCKFLEWGSATHGSGKGKECNESIAVAVYFPTLKDMYILEVRKGRATKLDKYLGAVTAQFVYPAAVYTEFNIGFNEQDLFAQAFSVSSEMKLDRDTFNTAISMIEEGERMIAESVKQSLSYPSDEGSEPGSQQKAPEGRKSRR